MTETKKNRFRPVFWYFRIRQPVAVACCLFLGQKTGPDRTCEHYLWMFQVLHVVMDKVSPNQTPAHWVVGIQNHQLKESTRWSGVWARGWAGAWQPNGCDRKSMVGPIEWIIVAVARVSAQLDLMFAKWGQRNIIHVCWSDIRLTV